MIQYQAVIKIQTTGKLLYNVTSKVQTVVKKSGISTGLCSLFLRHTSASLIIQENADPDVLLDLQTFFSKLVPEDNSSYLHSAEGPDDMPAHIKTALTHTSEQIPISYGRLLIGTWQGIFIWEHRQQTHIRELIVHIIGE
jgi:secondary thiamine-phosphate synthase enzyme